VRGPRRLVVLLSLLLMAAAPVSAGLERVAPEVLEALGVSTRGREPLLVRWSEPTMLPAPRDGETRREVRRRVVAALREQAGVGARVSAQLSRSSAGLRPQSLWIVNATVVQADRQALLNLAHQPGVRAILPSTRLRLFTGVSARLAALSTPLLAPFTLDANEPPLPWHVAKLRASEVWAQGITGEGVVVANIDTGGDLSHPALRTRYRGTASGTDERNWFDAALGRSAPYDDMGHGTQTLGSIVGNGGPGNRIGVAPEARWIAVKAADSTGDLNLVNVLRAMQWLLAPTDRNGEHPDPDMAPDVVSNSWGDYPGADETLRDAVRAWVAAGIVPVFAAGNNGAGGVGSPGSYPEAIAVGATDGGDTVAPFSSRGPSPIDESVKPDVVAPGVFIRSAAPGGVYFPNTGTSMATPQVAGIAALLLQADPSLTPPLIANILRSTADPVPPAPLPNNDVGWGRVNALAAVNSLRSRPSP
jgi:bacillopeptidase F